MLNLGCPIGRENELWSHSLFYDEKCGKCKFIVQIGGRKFCGNCPPRVALHQAVRGEIGCMYCDNYSRRLDSPVCLKCLADHPNAEKFELWKQREDCVARYEKERAEFIEREKSNRAVEEATGMEMKQLAELLFGEICKRHQDEEEE